MILPATSSEEKAAVLAARSGMIRQWNERALQRLDLNTSARHATIVLNTGLSVYPCIYRMCLRYSIDECYMIFKLGQDFIDVVRHEGCGVLVFAKAASGRWFSCSLAMAPSTSS